MKASHSTHIETSDAVLLLEAPRREAPRIEDTSRAAFSYGLLLTIPAALILAAWMLLPRLVPALPALPLALR
jgi:hypothetical protein